ncbi:MAG: sodium-dependent transporter [Cellulomonadaceae bacterium]|jgi:NSS family neurotransmitter:Na+ symporter|nr:sodium-dependent transporter [Cellulomonadaceae bacterium]
MSNNLLAAAADSAAPAGFKRRIGLILTMAGFAVGLGNVWRFPHFAATYGGGAFVVIYIALMFTFGLALMIAEVSIGRRTGKSTIEAMTKVNGKFKWIGLMAVLVSAIVFPYYSVIAGWVGHYAGRYLTGQGAGLEVDGTFAAFNSSIWAPILWAVAFIVINAALVHAGVQKGIERLNTIAMPVLVILMAALAVYGLTLPGAGAGVQLYLVPDWSQVTLLTFVAAVRQIFFSIGLAWGVMVLYGSYMKKDEAIEKTSIQILGADTIVALIAGLMVIPMAASFQALTEPMEGVRAPGQGAGMLFNTMPQVFESMGSAGMVIAAAFFTSVFLAALTSSVSMMEVPVAAIMAKTGWARGKTVWIMAAAFILLAIPASLGFGAWSGVTLIAGNNILNSMAFVAESTFMPLVALFTSILIGWVVGPKWMAAEVRESGQPFKLEGLITVMIKWIVPIIALVVFISSMLMTFGNLTL